VARIVRVVVPGACYVGRSLARRDHKRKLKILKIKYGVPGIRPKIKGRWRICVKAVDVFGFAIVVVEEV
jgi:hypothetical protein